jgi:hypothetical protein
MGRGRVRRATPSAIHTAATTNGHVTAACNGQAPATVGRVGEEEIPMSIPGRLYVSCLALLAACSASSGTAPPDAGGPPASGSGSSTTSSARSSGSSIAGSSPHGSSGTTSTVGGASSTGTTSSSGQSGSSGATTSASPDAGDGDAGNAPPDGGGTPEGGVTGPWPPSSTFSNPPIWQDLPDDEIINVNGTYYYTASTMHYSPGAPILRSWDLVNWEYVGHAVPVLNFPGLSDNQAYNLSGGQAYIKGIWASSLHYR